MLETNRFAELSEGHGTLTSPVHRARILAVDDDENMLEVLREGLTRAEFKCATSRCVDEASMMLQGQEFDLVLLDVAMPGKSGMEFLPEIKAWYPDTAVLMLTGQLEVDTAVSAMQHGVYDYVTKPVAMAELGTRIERALGKRAAVKADRERQEIVEQQVSQRTREITALNNLIQREISQHVSTQEAYTRLNQATMEFGSQLRELSSVARVFSSGKGDAVA